MAKISAQLRAKLLSEKQRLSNRVVIDLKNFEKGTYRLLPPKNADSLPGVKYVQIFSKALGFGTTSPATFGFKCAISDYLEKLRRNDKKASQEATALANLSTEHWEGVVDKNDMGTVEAPIVKILRFKYTPYKQIIDQFTEGDESDPDSGDDIRDPADGRYFRLKKETGKSGNTEWKISKFHDRSRISDDEDLQTALIAAYHDLDIIDKMYKTDQERYSQIYENLTGEELPASFWKQKGLEGFLYVEKDDDRNKGRTGKRLVDRDEDEEEEKQAKKKVMPKDEEEEAEEADTVSSEEEAEEVEPTTEAEDGETVTVPEGLEEGVTQVRFEMPGADGEESSTIEGLLTKLGGEMEDGDVEAEVTDESGEKWNAFASLLTIVPPIKAKPKIVSKAPSKTPGKSPAQEAPKGKTAATGGAVDKIRRKLEMKKGK